jgi:hypothetical protein
MRAVSRDIGSLVSRGSTMTESTYLIALKAESMESRAEVTQWLKELGAVHVLADVWLLKGLHGLAGDIARAITRWKDFDGSFIVVKLFQSTDWAHHGLSEEAESWIRKSLDE